MKLVRVLAGAALAVAAIVSLTAFTSTQSSPTQARSAQRTQASQLTIGEMLTFTGAKSLLSSWGSHGSRVGIYEVNKAGGVLGQKIQAATAAVLAQRLSAIFGMQSIEV